MRGIESRKTRWGAVLLLAGVLVAGCGKKNSSAQIPAAGSSAEPDKILFDKAQEDIKKGHHQVARLTLQTLINSYPDSEYLAKAKLAICESYYKEGGTSGLTQAAAECKDFRTFFPYLEEAAYAQWLIAQSHYRRMEKPDRDRSQGRLAEAEFQELLLQYPNSKWAKEGEQRLREVQEVLAEGDYRVGHFYFMKDTPNGYRAAIYRLAEVADRYPLYSQADKALWMVGESLAHLEQSQAAGRYFERIVRDYPLSPLVDDAKKRLEKLGVPIPQPDPKALARMQQEQNTPHEKRSFVSRGLGIMKGGPDVSAAARVGQPNLTPPPEGPSESLIQGQTTLGGGAGTGSNNAVIVPTDPNSTPASKEPAANTSGSSTSSQDPNATTDSKQKDEKDVKENAKPKESSSKKKSGLRKIIPW